MICNKFSDCFDGLDEIGCRKFTYFKNYYSNTKYLLLNIFLLTKKTNTFNFNSVFTSMIKLL